MKYQKKSTILVIEDDALDAILIKESLDLTAFKIYVARCLQDGIKLLSDNIPFDAILLDLILPDSEGIQTFETLHSLAPYLPIIILTGVDDDDVVFHTLQNGAQDYLIKGKINSYVLERAIRYAIERKHIEHRLEEALDLNQKIFAATVQGILTYKASGPCIFANDAAAKILNTTLDKLLEQNFHLIESWKSTSLYDVACEVVKTGIPAQQEFNFITTFGNEVWLECYLASFSSMGETHLLLILNDKTTKKHIERSLEWKNYLMEMLMQNSPDAIYFKDLQGHFTDVSKAMSNKLGFADARDVIGKTDFDLFSYTHANMAYQDEQKIISTGEGIYNFEEKETYDNRPDTWVITSKMPLLDTNGRLIGTFGISRDITERKMAEEALIQSKYQLAEAMDVAQLYQWVYDISIGYFIFDEKLWDFFGKENIQQGFYQMSSQEYLENFIYPEDRHLFENEIKKAYETTDPEYFSQIEYRIVRLNGQIRHIMVRTRVKMDITNIPLRFYGILQDITDRKIALQKSFEALNQVDNVKTEFLLFISQEIRTPLNGIVGAVNLIKNQENSSAIRDLVEILDKSVSNLESFTDNATYYSKLANNYNLKISEFNLKDLIQFAILENENAINEKNLKITFEPTLNNIIIKADKDLIYKLLVNTLQIFTGISKKKDQITIEIGEEADCLICLFTNKNEIFPENLLKNFSTIAGIYHSRQIGLSLYIVKQIMDIHNSDIHIFNKDNAGATIKLLFKK